MPSKKVYIILLVAMVVFGIIMFVVFGVPNIRQDNIQVTLIVGDNTTWVYKEKQWFFMRYNMSIEQLNWSKFHVLEDNQDKGDYYLWHDDKWYVFDEQKNAVNLNGKMLAYQSNIAMKVLDFQESTVDDYTYVNQVLEDNGISTNNQFTSIYKVLVDFDGDSNSEEFYIVSNALPMDFEPNVTFSLAFMVKNDVIYPLYNDVSSYRGLNGCKPFYHSFIDTNSDGVYEVVLSCGQFSASDQVDMLYQFEDGNFNLLISNQ